MGNFKTFDNTINYIVGFLGVLGLVGNFLCTITLGRKEMRSNCFHQLCLALVIFDSLHIFFAFWEGIYWTFRKYYPHFLLMIYPWFHYPLYRITLVGSIYMVISTSVERYLAVCHPHSYHRMNTLSWRFMYYLIPAVVGAIVVCFPKFFEIEIKLWCHNTTHYRQEPDGTELRYNHAYIIGYIQCFYMITTMILPLIILIVLSLRIHQGLIKVKKNLDRHKKIENNTAQNAIEKKKKITSKFASPAKEEEEVAEEEEMIPLQAMNNDLTDDLPTIHKTTSISNQIGQAGLVPIVCVGSMSESNADCWVPLTCDFNNLGSTIKTKAAIAQRKLLNITYKREANMAVVLVSTVIMFVICHMPRMLFVLYEVIMHQKFMMCRQYGLHGDPFWYLYSGSIIKLLQVWNAAGNFLIYYFMGISFRQNFHALFES